MRSERNMRNQPSNNSRSRQNIRRKIKKPFYTKWWLWLIVLFVLIGSGFGIKSFVNYRHWSVPYYNQAGDHVLLSSNVDKFNDDQEKSFYAIAQGAIESKEKNISFDNLNDKSLYVEKLKELII